MSTFRHAKVATNARLIPPLRGINVVVTSFKSSPTPDTEVATRAEKRKQVAGLLESVGISQEQLTGRTGYHLDHELPSADDVEEILRILVDVMHIKITDIKDVLEGYPGLLFGQQPENLIDRYDILLAAWPSEAQLKASILEYPMILDTTFTVNLQKCMNILGEVGFESKQIARMIVKQPNIVLVRKFEINNVIKRLSMDINDSFLGDTSKISLILRFLARNPEALLPSHFKDVLYPALEKMHSELGISISAAVLAVVRSNKVYKRCTDDFDSMILLMKHLGQYCENEAHAVQIVETLPQLLSMKLSRFDQSIFVMRSLNLGPDVVLSYPRIFLQDPFEVVGPRMAFMKAYHSEKKLRIATFLSIGEEAFASKYVRDNHDKYNELVQYYSSEKHEGLKNSRSSEMEREKRDVQNLTTEGAPSPKPQQKASQPKPRRFWKKRMKRLPRISPSSTPS